MGVGSQRSSHWDEVEYPQWNPWSFLIVGGGSGPLEWVSPGPRMGSGEPNTLSPKHRQPQKDLGMITGRCQSTRGVGAEPHSRSHQGRHPQPRSPRVPQKDVSAQRTPTRGQPKDTQPSPAPGAIHKQPTLSNSFSSCSRGHGERGQQILCRPSFFWVVFFILASFLSCVPSSLASGLENSSCVLARDKCLARYHQPCPAQKTPRWAS